MAYGRNILLLCALISLSSIATNLIGPFLSLYIVSLGASVTELGLVIAISNAVTAALLIPSGILSDKYGRKKLHAFGTFLAIFPPLLYTFAIHWLEVVPWLILSGVSLGFYMPIRWSIPADVSTVEKRAMAYSWTNVALLIGSTVGPVLGGLIAEGFKNIKIPFLVCFSLLWIAFLLTLPLQETGKRKESDQIMHLSDDPPKVMRFSEVITLVTLINILQGASIGLFFTLLSVFVVQRFSASDALVGLLYAVGFGLASLVVQLPGGRLANRYDRKRLILITFLISAPFYGLFALSQGLVELFLFMFLANAVLNLGWPASQALMMDLTPSAKWGLMNGIAGTTFWVGMMAGSAASGILWDSFSMFFPFYMSMVTALFSAIPVLFLKETRAKKLDI